ncbi:hypothetical protein JIP62_07390 [Brevundimonas vitis]|uniref:Uncharacterized protein n=1 Tax=Brevundimonas vitisensis TaxID=2800818 RepID=A0ABX7BQK6_9CAUL|nr:hypothetical protein [Brevundimonas vitisensis]QQQ19898.1 hypothetical protein JIP62_07390 [Brevundimonas vitisensis]
MFKFLAIPAVAVSLLAVPAQAQETSVLFGHFKTLCGDGAGDSQRALVQAEAAGWAKIPSELFTSDPQNPFENVTAMMNAEDNGDLSILMVGSMSESVGPGASEMDMTVCAVMGGNFETNTAVKPDPRPFVQRWLNMDTHPSLNDQGMMGYAFNRDGTRLTAIRPTEAAMTQAALNGDLHIVMMNDEQLLEGATMIMYMRPAF